MKTEVLRAYRLTLAPSPAQEHKLLRWCGNARLAFNYALAAKKAAHVQWRAKVDELVAGGTPEAQARKQTKVPIPSKPTVHEVFNAERSDTREDVEGVCPWWHEIFQSAFIDADRAWKNWLESFTGKRAGRRVGYPRFKKRGRARDSFRLHHDVKKPGIRLTTHRRLRLASFGEVRLHDSGKRLFRQVARDEAVVQSVTVSRGEHRWYASVLCKVTLDVPDRASRAQAERGKVGVDIGVKVLAALSQPLGVWAGGRRRGRDADRQSAAAARGSPGRSGRCRGRRRAPCGGRRRAVASAGCITRSLFVAMRPCIR
ncbi:helix-turn-helix domain-containing protein [Streptomyces sp. NPDC004296]|uniref:helix-turn-helix domain-containing protein n=1 Tax=Streptomyces sp. NPDC004296 TaxID=3364697 RepID=UPI00369E583A